MKQGLKEINDLASVWGSLVCDNQGEVIESASPSTLNSSVIGNICRHSIEMLTGSGEQVQGLEEMVLYFQQRRLYVQDLEQAILIVFCTPSIDISLLRLTINVVTSRWENDQKVNKLLSDRFIERI